MGSLRFQPGTPNSELLPDGLSESICANWIYFGKQCNAAYGHCSAMHKNFDCMRSHNRKLLADHVVANNNLWFDRRNVRSLTEEVHKLKLGGPGGPGTD